MKALILLLIAIHTALYSFELKGTIVDQSNNPVVGASVSVMGTSAYGVTDSQGEFRVDSPVKPQSTPILFKQNKVSTQTVSMESSGQINWPSTLSIDEISVTNVHGRLLFNEVVTDKEMTALPSLAMGVYILSINYNGHSVHRKFKSNSKNDIQLSQRNLLESSVSSFQLRSQFEEAPSKNEVTIRIQHDNYMSKTIPITTNDGNNIFQLQEDPSGVLFNMEKLNAFYITISDSALEWLNLNAVKEEYVPATLTFKGKTIGDVGLRYQGSNYNLAHSFDSTGKITPKVSMKVKCNKYDKDLRFYGLKKIMFKAFNGDLSHMRSLLSYELLNEVGVITPRTAFCKLYVNGKYEGVFQTTEQIDGRFTKRHFPELGDGNLYKEVWPTASSSAEVKDALKTNEDEEDVSKWEEFATDLLLTDSSDFKKNINRWIDMDYFLKFMVVDRAVEQWDGIMTWYGKRNHNYYWYEEEQAGGKQWIIPWDYDLTFTLEDELFEVHDIPYWNTGFETCGEYNFRAHQVLAPTCDELISMVGTQYWDEFVTIGEDFLEGPFSVDSLENKVSRWVELIDDAVSKDPNLNIKYELWKWICENDLIENFQDIRNNFIERLDLEEDEDDD